MPQFRAADVLQTGWSKFESSVLDVKFPYSIQTMEMNVNLRGSTFNLVADYYESYAPSVFDLLVANRLYGYLIIGIR